MEAFCAAHVFIRFCSQERHRGALQIRCEPLQISHTLRWPEGGRKRRQLHGGGLFECITSSAAFMKISASLKTSLFHESRISAGPVHDTRLQWDFSVSAAVFNLQCPVLGEITFFVCPFFFFFRLKRAKRSPATSQLLSKTSCDRTSFDPFWPPLNAAVERGPEGLHPQMIKKSELLVCLSCS